MSPHLAVKFVKTASATASQAALLASRQSTRKPSTKMMDRFRASLPNNQYNYDSSIRCSPLLWNGASSEASSGSLRGSGHCQNELALLADQQHRLSEQLRDSATVYDDLVESVQDSDNNVDEMTERGASSTHQDVRSYIEVENAKSTVVVWSKSYCPYSTATKNLLFVMFPELDVVVHELDWRPDGDAILQELESMTGDSSVPFIFIRNRHVGDNVEFNSHLMQGNAAMIHELLGTTV